MNSFGIRHLSVTLGDQKIPYREIPGIEGKIKEFRLPDDPKFWGWGHFRRSSGTYEDHIARGFAESTAFVLKEDVDVDAIVICDPCRGDVARLASRVTSEILPRLQVSQERLHFVSTRDCVNVLEAIEKTRSLIASGLKNVLILAAEKIEDEADRFREYAFFSDFSLALLMSGEPGACKHQILDVQIRADLIPAIDQGAVLRRNLEKECLSSLLTANKLEIKEVEKFFYLNLFQPIAELKGKGIGFKTHQLETHRCTDIAHCFGADPLISMHAFAREATSMRTQVLCASAREVAGADVSVRVGAALISSAAPMTG